VEYPNYLSIRERGKGIPYFGDGVAREDGDANHGFKNLKTNPDELDSIPELAVDPPLKALVAAINAPHTGLFSVGCVSGPVHDEERGHRRTGYVEFALNSVSRVQDARNYFPAFFYFNKLLHREQFATVKFDWQLEGAHFTDVDVGGFSCTVFVNTQFFSSATEAEDAWRRALELLAALLGDVPDDTRDPIYAPPSFQADSPSVSLSDGTSPSA